MKASIRRWQSAIGLVIIGVVVSFGAQAQSDQARVTTIHHQAAGWSRDMNLLMSVLTDDVVYEDAPLGLVLRGKEQVRQFAEGFFRAFPDLRSTCKVVVVHGDTGFCEWQLTGTQAADLPNIPSRGRKMNLPGVSIYEFEGNKIKRTVDYWDLNTLLRQLGALPEK